MKQKLDNFLCFSAETAVLMSNDLIKNIENIEIGDKVLNFNIEKNIVESTMVEIKANSRHSVLNIVKFSNDVILESTQDHPFFIISKGWCSAKPEITNKNYHLIVGKMQIGDKCLHYSDKGLQEVEVVSIEAKIGSFKMYVISGGENNSFFANGIVVSDENIMALDLNQLGVQNQSLVR